MRRLSTVNWGEQAEHEASTGQRSADGRRSSITMHKPVPRDDPPKRGEASWTERARLHLKRMPDFQVRGRSSTTTTRRRTAPPRAARQHWQRSAPCCCRWSPPSISSAILS